jgi:hypothetical protein
MLAATALERSRYRDRCTQEALEAVLGDSSGFVRASAALALWKLGYKNRARLNEVFLRCLEDRNHYIRGAACEVYAELGKDARHILPRLRKIAQNADEWDDVRESAVYAIRQITADPGPEKDR